MTGTETLFGDRSEFVAAVQKADSLSEIAALIQALQQRLGYAFYTLYAQQSEATMSLRKALVIYSCPEAFIDGFDRLGIHPQQAALSRASPTLVPLQWTHAIFGLEIEPGDRATLLGHLAEHGIYGGFFFPSKAVDGVGRILSFCGDRPALSPEEMEELSYRAIQLIDRVRVLETRQTWSEGGLSSLEMQCLSLACEGWQSGQIGDSLALSARTVMYLVASLCRKMEAESLEHAAAMAMRRGDID